MLKNIWFHSFHSFIHVKKFSHSRTGGGVLYECMLTVCWPTMMILWWSGWHQVTVPLLGGAWQNPRLGVVSLFISGASVDVLLSTVVVLSPLSLTAQTGSHSCVCQTGNYHQGCCPILCNFVRHSSNYTKFSIVGRVLLAKLAQERYRN